MYEVIHNGRLIGFCETPRYIRVKNGIYINAKKNNAEGVAFNSTAYLFKDNTFIKEVDGGEYVIDQIKETEQEITEQDLATIEAEQMITDLDLRVTELEARDA